MISGFEISEFEISRLEITRSDNRTAETVAEAEAIR